MDISRLIEWLKLSLTQVSAVFLASSFFVFAPNAVADRIALGEIRAAYRGWAAVVMLASGALVVTLVAPHAYRVVSEPFHARIARRARISRLHSLSDPEKKALRRYLDENTRTQLFDISDGVAQGLLREGVLWKPSSVSAMRMEWAYNLQPWAWDYLHDDPDLVAGTGDAVIKRKAT